MYNTEIIEEINDANFFVRKISKDDINFIYESLNNPDMTIYLSIGPLISKKSTKKLVKMYLKSWLDQSQFNYIIEIRERNEKKKYIKKVGSISIWNVSWLHRRAEIGIWIV
jgi:RimJ/RimL family protein N-acetyltransferase